MSTEHMDKELELQPQTEEVCEAEPEQAAEQAAEKSAEKPKKERKTKKLEETIQTLEADKADLADRLLRKTAEFDNFRKRTEREKREAVGLGTAAALEAVLPAFDTLKLAAMAPCADENYKKGVEMTLASFRSGLEKLGVQEIDPIGQPFDPKLHNAVFTEPAEEGAESGIVTKVLQSGYIQGERVIRCAMVAVSE